jgi:Ca2+-transporting ATPase
MAEDAMAQRPAPAGGRTAGEEIPLPPAVGLSVPEATRRLRRYGRNEIPGQRRRPIHAIVLGVLREPMFLFLVIAAALYLALGDPLEGAVLSVIAIIDVGLVTFQELRTERVIEALREIASPRALVVRDRQEVRIPGAEIVPGDVVILSEGDRVPADGRLLTSHDLQTDESLLTGESVPVRKRAPLRQAGSIAESPPGGDDLPFVYSGSLIVSGQGVAEVVATGASAYIGRIGASLAAIRPERTRLQKSTARLVWAMAAIGVIVSLTVIVLFGTLRGDWLEGALAGMTVAMSALPEEFPLVLTVFLALGAWRLSRAGVLTRRSAVIETLGTTTALCVDKTGTVTQNRMTVSQLYADGVFLKVRPNPLPLPERFHELVEYAILASKPRPFDPTEQAMHRLGAAALTGTEHLHASWRLVQEYELTPGFLAMSQAWRGDARDEYIIAAKGAPESIVDLCHLGEDETRHIAESVQMMARQGLRIIAVAQGRHRGPDLPAHQHDFVFAFVGLIGLEDPLRPTVANAVDECRRAGIRIIMITGDYVATAESIARQAGLNVAGGAMTGAEIEALEESELRRRIRAVTIFARIRPEQKLRLVGALKANGEIVAMTGDGVNDAPALRAAHVGIAMGQRGTDVAREAASLVLLDDDFGAIVGAVRLGRRIFDNLRKAMAYITAIHVPILGMALAPWLFGWPIVLSPFHVVFLEMVIDPVCSIVFEAEPEESDIMRRPPRPFGERLFAGWTLGISLVQGFVLMLIVLTVYGGALALERSEGVARTVTFVSMVTGNLALAIANRSWSEDVIAGLMRPNRSLWIAVAAAFGGLALVVGVPPVRELFRFEATSAVDLTVASLCGVLSVLWFEIAKATGLVRRISRYQPQARDESCPDCHRNGLG